MVFEVKNSPKVFSKYDDKRWDIVLTYCVKVGFSRYERQLSQKAIH